MAGLGFVLMGAAYYELPTQEQLSAALALIRQRSTPDTEMAYFEVEALLEQGKLVLRGKVGDVEQKLLLLAGFRQFRWPVVDRIEVFPFRQFSTPYAWVRTPWLDGYAEPNPQAVLKTQFLLGSFLRILKTQGDWALVQSVADRSLAWIRYPEVLPVSAQKYEELLNHDSVIVQTLDTVLYQDNALTHPVQTIPAGSRLPLLQMFGDVFQVLMPDTEGIRVAFLPKSRVRFFIPGQAFSAQALIEEARRWLKVPYREGGATVYGWDMAAYIQYVYRQVGVLLPRRPQQLLPATLPIREIAQLKAGDIFFYGTQVGLYLGQDEVLHALPEQQRFVISSLHPGDPRYKRRLRMEFRQGARLLLGNRL